MAGGVTISQAAAFAGVTVKTVRHYHRLGLVAEPDRDSSGYRRYGSAELLRLVQVRTLAEAGVPLAEIGDLLDADPERFAADVADVKARLAERIAELASRREMLDRLASGNRLLLPDRAIAILDRAAELDFPPDYLAAAHEGLVLAKAVIPDFDGYLADVEASLKDLAYVELLRRSWDASSWDPDDPRLEQLAKDYAAHLIAHPELLAVPSSLNDASDGQSRAEVIEDYRHERADSSSRLAALMRAELRAAGITIR
ncbi:MAG TPA: MerR family transcriptional regulator [Stackebrandtia sp.]|nr:MerR family transcriptional regulator [Stackebrandtia sp.]